MFCVVRNAILQLARLEDGLQVFGFLVFTDMTSPIYAVYGGGCHFGACSEIPMSEWIAHGGRLNPLALKSNGVSYEKWLQWMNDDEHEDTCPPESVPQTIYFAVRDDGKLIGAVTIRTKPNEKINNGSGGGHLGFGVRPTERRKGYAKKILRLALKKLAERGINDVMINCASDNIGSEKTILACGATFQDEVINDEGERAKRFWIYDNIV